MEQLLYEVKKVIVGQDHLLERMVVALLARGHLLVEGVPGLAKTMAIKTLAQAIGGEFKRIQFTPDLVPADLVGTRIYNQKTGEFTTSLGPVFTNLLLADEINRAPAKVQCALLEVMQERQVTIGHDTHAVPDPFLVLATQNPIETEGTYALPEAQVDRFMLKVVVGYPTPTEEFAIVERMTGRLDARPAGALDRRSSWRSSRSVDRVYVDPALYEYAVRLSGATRTPRAYGMPELERYITYGASPRASINLILTARALAYVRGREYVAPAGRPRHGPGRHAPPARALVRGALGRHHQRRASCRRSSAASRRRPSRSGTMPPRRCLTRPPAGRRPSASSSASTGRSSGAWTACSRATTAACSAAPASTSPRCASTSRATTSGAIDWNVTARTTIPYVREYHEDREITAWFLLDLSPSVDFGTVDDGRLKRTVLVDFMATLARLLTRRGNRVGAMLFASERRPDDPGRAAGAPRSCGSSATCMAEPRLEQRAGHGPRGAVRGGARQIRRRSMVVIVSDFISAPGWEKPLHLLNRRHEVLAVRLDRPARERAAGRGADRRRGRRDRRAAGSRHPRRGVPRAGSRRRRRRARRARRGRSAGPASTP